MAFSIGLLLAGLVSLFARVIGLDRDRAFYPTVMIVIALYYVLFAVMGASGSVLVVEAVLCGAFVVAAAVGFRYSLWIVVFALGAHGIMDLVHASFVENPGVPFWWPEFCSTYDVAAAVFLGWLLKTERIPANPSAR